MLIDTNIVIYACRPEYDALRRFIAEHAPSVSIVTKVEALGYHRLSGRETEVLTSFFDASHVRMISTGIADQAIGLRQQKRLSLGDSLIAGTALVNDLTLVTANTQDFSWISGLDVLNPLENES